MAIQKITKATLIDLYTNKKLSARKIAEITGISSHRKILRYLEEYDIKRRPRSTTLFCKNKEKLLRKMKEFAELGFNDKEIAVILNVSKGTIVCWKKAYPEIIKTLEIAREKSF